MVELLGGKVTVKTTLEGQNDWKIIYTGTETINFDHFDAFVTGDKLYVYLMQDTGNNTPGVGDKRPLYFQEFTLSEVDAPDQVESLILEAEDYTTASSNIVVGTNPGASGGKYIDAFAVGQFLEYKFQVANAGTYDFIILAANRNRDDSTMGIEINGNPYGNVLITRTFDWGIYLETIIPDITLNQGENIVKITQNNSLSSEPDKLEFKRTSTLSTGEFDKNTVTIYPNPSSGLFHVKTSISNPIYSVKTMLGQVLEKGVLRNNVLNLSNYTSGIYFLELSSEEGRLVKKIVIE